MDEHEEAVKATARRLRHAQSALLMARTHHIDAVLEALRADLPPMAIAALSPFTDSYLRQIAREAGIPAAKKRRRSPAG